MAKWFGKIGFAEQKEVEPGIWEETITEQPYYGNVEQDYRKVQNSGDVNDDINISNKISVIADSYISQNISNIRYLIFMGVEWKVTDIQVQYPRLVLSLGGKYNGNSLRATE